MWTKKEQIVGFLGIFCGFSAQAAHPGEDYCRDIIIEDSYKTLTGSGPATWTHDHTASGVHDLCGNIWEFARGVRIRDGALWAAENNDAALPETDLTECGDGWKPITDAEGHPLYVAVEDNKITFNTYPSIHRDYCGCAWGNVRMNCDSEQLRALALFAGEEKAGCYVDSTEANTYCFAVATGTMAATLGCSILTCTTRAPMPSASSGAVPLISRSTETPDTETLTAKR